MVLLVIMISLFLLGFWVGYTVARAREEKESWLPPTRRRWRP